MRPQQDTPRCHQPGSRQIKDGDRHAALLCYRSAREELLDGAPPQVQERFLKEYIEHVRRLARGRRARTYRDESISVGTDYLTWYANAPAAVRDVRRLRIIVFYLGDAYVAREQRQRLIATYNGIAANNPAAFTEDAVELWDGSIRTHPETQKGLSADEIRTLLAAREDFRINWEAYRAFLEKLANDPEMQSLAQQKLANLKAFLPEPPQ